MGAAGAMLAQKNEMGIDKPVSYFSKKFDKHQLNYYVIIEKETLALILTIHHYDVYLGGGQQVTVHTDHNPITFLQSLRCPNQRLICWSLVLQSYNLDIQFIRGQHNIVADALSWAPVL